MRHVPRIEGPFCPCLLTSTYLVWPDLRPSQEFVDPPSTDRVDQFLGYQVETEFTSAPSQDRLIVFWGSSVEPRENVQPPHPA